MPARKKPVKKSKKKLSHVSARGEAKMVDVSGKPSVPRMAKAIGVITLSREAFAAAKKANAPKGDVLATARLAGVQAAKRTSELIPLCHPLALTDVQVEFKLESKPPTVACMATVRTVGPTGVEMEALTAVSVALLTIYDMTKAIDSEAIIGPVTLLEKRKG